MDLNQTRRANAHAFEDWSTKNVQVHPEFIPGFEGKWWSCYACGPRRPSAGFRWPWHSATRGKIWLPCRQFWSKSFMLHMGWGNALIFFRSSTWALPKASDSKHFTLMVVVVGVVETPSGFSSRMSKAAALHATVFGTPYYKLFTHMLWKFQTQVTQGQVTRPRQVTSPHKKFECSSKLHRLNDCLQSFSGWYK